MSAASRNARQRLLELVQVQMLRSPATLGRCPACKSEVRPGDGHLRLRGEVYHTRCSRYGGRAPSL